MPLIKLTVESRSNPERIDSYLAGAGLGISRSQIKKLFGEGRVTLNGQHARVSRLVTGGEQIEIDQPDEHRVEFAAENIPITIVYEDDDLAVVNKPAGMVTHPAIGNRSGTLANALLHHFHDLSTGYAGGYPGLIHRLDKNTTGLLVVAKNDRSQSALSAQLQDRSLSREYLAIVWGTMRPPTGTISLAIGRSRVDRRIMTSGSPKTREAITHYETVEDWGLFSYIRIKLQTGRTHQIRTHFKESGHPIFGDPEYGGRDTRTSGIEAKHRLFVKKLLAIASRQLLHAAAVRFVHPTTGKSLEFLAELPEDFRQALELVRLYR